jgi:hypothetical protein
MTSSRAVAAKAASMGWFECKNDGHKQASQAAPACRCKLERQTVKHRDRPWHSPSSEKDLKNLK